MERSSTEGSIEILLATLPGADPDLGSWAVAATLLLAGVVALWVVARAGDPRARLFWLVVCVGATALAVNKQLDAHGYLTDGPAAPVMSALIDWARGASRPTAGVIVAAVVGAAGVTVVWLTSGMARYRLAIAAVAILALALALRAADIVRLGPVPARLDHGASLPLEFAGAALLLLAASRQAWLGRP